MGNALGSKYPTLLTLAQIMHNDKLLPVVEILNQMNEHLDDMPFYEANDSGGHVFAPRTALPAVSWRRINKGVPPTKSSYGKLTETLGSLESYSNVDKDLAQRSGDVAAFRAKEARGHLEAMGQEHAQTMVYGDVMVAAEEYTGLSPRYYSYSEGVAKDYVLTAGGSATLTSIWLCGWGENTGYGIYPKGSQLGFEREDKGQQTLYDEDGNPFEGYSEHFAWKAGLCIENYKYFVRIPNINVAALQTFGAESDTSADILKFMTLALEKIPNLQACNPVFYCSRTVRAMFRLMAEKKIGGLLVQDFMGANGLGRSIPTYHGVPIRIIDQMSEAETLVA